MESSIYQPCSPRKDVNSHPVSLQFGITRYYLHLLWASLRMKKNNLYKAREIILGTQPSSSTTVTQIHHCPVWVSPLYLLQMRKRKVHMRTILGTSVVLPFNLDISMAHNYRVSMNQNTPLDNYNKVLILHCRERTINTICTWDFLI